MKPVPILICGYALLLNCAAGAQEAKPKTTFDPGAQAVVDQMIAAYKSLTVLHERISSKSETSPGILAAPSGFQMELRWQKPNKIWYRSEEWVATGKTHRAMIVCDGVRLWRWQSETNT